MATKAAENKKIQIDVRPDGIAWVKINRPESLNSLTRQMIIDLARGFRSLDADDSVKVIVIHGAGRAFCSGVDLTAAEDVFKGDVRDVDTDTVFQMDRCRKPIIGAVNGFAVTAGFEICLACDILIAGRDAKFVDTHSRYGAAFLSPKCRVRIGNRVYSDTPDLASGSKNWNGRAIQTSGVRVWFGIFPSWGLSQKLARVIGPNRAREVSLSSMVVTAEMAERWGLVNHVVEPSDVLKKAQEIAERIVKNNHDLVLRYKAVINDGLKVSLGDALALEKVMACACHQNPILLL
ncbi:putative enoyl-CoA hydratase 1 [Nymphaea thermarum]|nr:putative enoyl-CoA hydratase 1 [Nymphaea thermarum]